MHRHLQFGTRENPASNRRHGSRLPVASRLSENHTPKGTDASPPISASDDHPPSHANTSLYAAPHRAATGEVRLHENRLLTVRDVAELLRVSASWVYGRTRKRSLERLPGYRLGKYWRFHEDEVLQWVRSHCGDRSAT